MIIVNGIQQDTIPVSDRGLQYGDGLFETIRILNGKACLLERHLERLAQGCSRLAIPLPEMDMLQAEAVSLGSAHANAILKIIITRGSGGRGYRSPENVHPTRILSIHPWLDYPAHYYSEGVTVRWCETRLSTQPRLAGIKHLNRLEQVLARNEWDDSEIVEGLMCNAQGEVIEGTMSNLFVVRNGSLVTPGITDCGVAGVMRRQVVDWASRHRLDCSERALSREEVMQADEIFLTNSLIGIWPVKAIGTSEFSVGPLTQRLIEALNDLEGV